MTFYNAKRTPDGIRITKFDDDLEVSHDPRTGEQSSYLTSNEACTCPAGHRDSCRHRQMLPEFLARGRIGSWWFLDWDNRKWVDPFRKAWRRI